MTEPMLENRAASVKRVIDDLDVAGRRVLLRVDFNVPLKAGKVVDDRRIRGALPTILSLRERGARVVIMTHVGRPRGQVVPELSTQPLADRLGHLIGASVGVARDVVGPSATGLVAAMNDGEVVMLENVRFEPGEERNDDQLAQRMAQLGDIYCNDAFGTAHRAHASTEAVAHYLPSAAGRLMARELSVLGGVLDDAPRPLVAILGGAKISTKLGVLENLLERVDVVWVGGAMACTFYRAAGASVGRSLVEEDQVETARRIRERAAGYRARLFTPADVVVAAGIGEGNPGHVVPWDAIPDDEMVVDIGPETVRQISAACQGAGTIVWNGPLGVYEVEASAQGTRAVARAIVDTGALTIVGGGDLGAAVEDAGVADRIGHISTGGGATLELLEGRVLPGVAVLPERDVAAAATDR